MSGPQDAAAYAAFRAIETGEWDRHLDALAQTIHVRVKQIILAPHPCRGCNQPHQDHPNGECEGWY